MPRVSDSPNRVSQTKLFLGPGRVHQHATVGPVLVACRRPVALTDRRGGSNTVTGALDRRGVRR